MHGVGHAQRRAALAQGDRPVGRRRHGPGRGGGIGQPELRQHAFLALVQLQRIGPHRFVEGAGEVHAHMQRLPRHADVLQRMAQVAQQVAVGALAVLVTAAAEHGGRHQRGGHAVRQRGGQRGRHRGGQAAQAGAGHVEVPQAGRHAGHASGIAHRQIQLGGEQRAGRGRGAQAQAAALGGDAADRPEQRRDGARVEPRWIGRRGAPGGRQRVRGGVGVALEGRRRAAPVGTGSAAQHAGARMGRMGMKGLDHGECRGRLIRVAEAGRVATNVQLGAPMAQPQPVGTARRRGQPAQGQRPAQPAAARRGGGGRTGRLAARAQRGEQRAQVERQVQHHQQHGGVAEQVMPVEHRQVLVGHPEDAQPRRGQQVDQQQQAADGVEPGARGQPAAQRQRAGQQRGSQQRQKNPDQLVHAGHRAAPAPDRSRTGIGPFCPAGRGG